MNRRQLRARVGFVLGLVLFVVSIRAMRHSDLLGGAIAGVAAGVTIVSFRHIRPHP